MQWRQGQGGRASFHQKWPFLIHWCLEFPEKESDCSHRHGIKMQVTLGPLMKLKDHTNDLYKILKVDEEQVLGSSEIENKRGSDNKPRGGISPSWSWNWLQAESRLKQIPLALTTWENWVRAPPSASHRFGLKRIRGHCPPRTQALPYEHSNQRQADSERWVLPYFLLLGSS